MSTGSGDTSLVSQAPANRFMRWLLRYLTRNQLTQITALLTCRGEKSEPV